MNEQLYNKKSKEDLEKDLNDETFKRITLSFYKYVDFKDLSTFRDKLYKDLNGLNVLGRVYIAKEGINAQISIPENQYNNFTGYIQNDTTEK